MIQSPSATDILTSKNTTITCRAPGNTLSFMYRSLVAEIEVGPSASINVPINDNCSTKYEITGKTLC